LNDHLLRNQTLQFLLKHRAAHQHQWNHHQLTSARYQQMKFHLHHLLALEETAEETKSEPTAKLANALSLPSLRNTTSSLTFPKIPIAKYVGATKQPEPLVALP